MVRGALGLMSGTSLDGVDVAYLMTDGKRVRAFGPTGYRPFAAAERKILRAALDDANDLVDRTARPGALAEAEAIVTRASAEAVEAWQIANRAWLAVEGGRSGAPAPPPVDVVGFHGQTVLHRPEARLTVQLGDGRALAERLGLPVVYDFRAADVAAGGQGAPLVPVFHRALARDVDRPQPLAILNLGGVANVTAIDGDADPVACDVGPGNALIDDFVTDRTGAAMDAGGKLAAAGRVDEDAVRRLLGMHFFTLPPPKSLDRNAFKVAAKVHGGLARASLEDGAATLTAFTAAAVARVVPHLKRPPKSWIVAGGGAHNPTLLRMLAERLAPARVETAERAGWSSDHMEAQAFAFLAVRALDRLPLSYPSTTGVPVPMTGGVVARP
ncbi:anhydro-N-acetylmuramic acid kinase [Blastochloris viridis]|nr:anhydro-N-acetylmuramic acid kinase [Blastochloris viridis]ALK08916.1 Anhydro-N-acetylmuramic acid kinase [Blastochloris viridis]BAR97687.1 anhydro-N-acetylmuramic acid kinase [Blastochloris viridis]